MINPKLKARGSVPYGGQFSLSIPEKGMVGRGTNFNQLLERIKEYRRANAIPIGLAFEDEVEREVVLRYPQEAVETDPRIPPSDIRYSVEDVVAGTKMLARFKMAGSPLVSDEEAIRRSKICSTCGFQSDFTKPCSGACGGLKELVVSMIGSKTTPYTDRLRSCRVCKCFNEAAVFVPLEFQTDYLSDLQRSQFDLARTEFDCWKLG